jgi:beta-lactamase superfamily II metal-dependent hydrolase
MKLEALDALKGDCFLLSWDENNHLLIDSGTKGTYPFLKKKLTEVKKLEGIIVTHVDYDHIGGFIKLMAAQRPPIEPTYDIYINTPDLILSPNESDKVGYKHGIQFDKKLSDKGIIPKSIHLGINRTNTIDIKGLKLTILSPSKTILQALKKNWTAESLYKQYQKETKSSDKVGARHSNLKDYQEIIDTKEKLHKWKDDLINSSSIAFIAEYKRKKILFLADANPIEIEKELKKLGYSENKKLKVHLMKISHHGSKFNTSTNLLKVIDCDSFLISTNGRGPYYHPHRETIVKIAEYSRKDKTRRLNIYTNYSLNKKKFITTAEEKCWNLNIEKRKQFDL